MTLKCRTAGEDKSSGPQSALLRARDQSSTSGVIASGNNVAWKRDEQVARMQRPGNYFGLGSAKVLGTRR